MFAPFALTILWLLSVATRVGGGWLGSSWRHLWWILLIGGTLLLIPVMLYVDVKRAADALTWKEELLLAVPFAMVVGCWLGVAAHVFKIHQLRGATDKLNNRSADLVIDICLYPMILAVLATHGAFVMLTDTDSLDMSTTLAASSIFESWALASVLALFESYARIASWTKLLVYQFLIVNIFVNAAEFYVKGVAPCELCFEFGGTSCANLASQIETMPISTLVPMTARSQRSGNWLIAQLLQVPLFPAVLWLSGSLAIFVVSGFEHSHRLRLSGIGKDTKVWLLPITLPGSLVKLIGVKLIVGVIFLQPYILRIVLLDVGGHSRFHHSLGPDFWNAWLLSIEALLLHAFHWRFAYPIADFSDGGALANEASLILPPPGVLPGGNAQYGALPLNHETGDVPSSFSGGTTTTTPAAVSSEETHSAVTCLEKLVCSLFGICLLVSWVSLSSMLSLGICKPIVLNGYMTSLAGGTVFHTCDTAKVMCSPGFALAPPTSNFWNESDGGFVGLHIGDLATREVMCGKDQQWISSANGFSVPMACSVCASGHVGYPSCSPCSSEVHCSGHAVAVTDDGFRSACTCVCASRYAGDNCSNCAVGHIAYPGCQPCSNKLHCNGHAVSVKDDGNRTSCACTCGPRYEGPDCGRCAPGHINYPECTPCDVGEHCSGNAHSVTDDGTRSQCICSCKDHFGNGSCNSCSLGFVDYPECLPCSSERHCNGHAANASFDAATESSCGCDCHVGWEGSACSQCAVGHVNYPSCEACNNESHCSGHAKLVTDDGNRSTCKCTCQDAWAGADCSGFRTKQQGCTCKAEWRDCVAGIFCKTRHGCEGTSLFGGSWCQTSEGCETSWAYC